MYLEATVDADHRIHAVAIGDRIGTENLLGYEDFSARTVNATGGDSSPLLGSRLALGDGNVAIPAALQRTRRATHFAKCLLISPPELCSLARSRLVTPTFY